MIYLTTHADLLCFARPGFGLGRRYGGALLLSRGATIGPADLWLAVVASRPRARSRGPRAGEAAQLRSALEATGWNVSEAARAIGVSRATFYRKLDLYGIERPAAPTT